ncbi:hypothetical protein EDD17DRAFT_1509352 [Pisolithus thermaeus]|nr:hypothetical protein EDD17DRAFT_1509352 [Pisolithus thermaeus]
MESLSAARAELAHLERRELQLLQELMDVRKALAAQKVVLDELVKASAVPYIDRLPNELLAEIFLLLKDDVDERTILASVSRRWRAVLISIPHMWSVIDLDADYDCPAKLLGLYLERSCQAPLTIIIGPVISGLDVFLPHANRWHTLRVLGSTRQTLETISHITFPSLQRLSLYGGGLALDGVLTMRSWIPALKHLELDAWEPPLHRPLCEIIPAESLEELSITSGGYDWKFKQDSMHFPLLRRLALNTKDPIPLLEAIVAPKLTSFCFTPGHYIDPISKTFTGTKTKFDNVSHFALFSRHVVNQDTVVLVQLLCRIFRGIRHADIGVGYVPALVTYYGPRPIEYWTCIESLDIQGLALGSSEPFRRLVVWLEKRKRFGQRKLHLKLSCKPVGDELECCASVVLDGIPVSPQMYLPTSAGSPLSAARGAYIERFVLFPVTSSQIPPGIVLQVLSGVVAKQ